MSFQGSADGLRWLLAEIDSRDDDSHSDGEPLRCCYARPARASSSKNSELSALQSPISPILRGDGGIRIGLGSLTGHTKRVGTHHGQRSEGTTSTLNPLSTLPMLWNGRAYRWRCLDLQFYMLASAASLHSTGSQPRVGGSQRITTPSSRLQFI